MSEGRFQVRRAQADDWSDWATLRLELWPDSETDMVDLLELIEGEGNTCLLAFDAAGQAVGLAEASLRHDYVNGTSTSPVGFLEGWYVRDLARNQGIGRGLIEAVGRWARACGCTELASDTAQDNRAAQDAHRACGFTETERVVYYCMPLPTEPS